MKAFGFAAAAALVASALAHQNHGAAHKALHQLQDRQAANATCGCTPSVVTYYGQATRKSIWWICDQANVKA